MNSLARLYNSAIMKVDTDPDVFMSELYKLRDGLGDLDEAVSTERLTTINLDGLSVENIRS